VHTENEQNNTPKRKGKYAPGEQVASNKTVHQVTFLHQDEDGEYHPVTEKSEYFTLVRGSYYPMGNRFQYPKHWGKKYGATKLIEYILNDKKKQIEDAQLEIQKLERCLSRVQQWSDSE
jgi:hypothetical protein